MAVDKLVDSSQLDTDLSSVANAIRAKSGGSSVLVFPAGFVSEINSIVAGGPTLDDWLSDLVGSVAFNGQTVKQYAFAYHQGPNNGGIDFSLPNLTALPTGAIQETRAKSFSAPLVSSIQGSTFSMLFPASGQGVVVAFPAITTLSANTSLLGFAGQDGTIVPVLLSLPNFTGRTTSGSNAPLFGSDSGLIIHNDCGINEITQDPQKNVLPQSGVRVYIPLMTSCLPYDFAYLPRLVTAELPNFTSLADHAFVAAQMLATVDISSVTTIGNYAFSNCAALTTIDCSAATTIGQHAFSVDKALAAISLPSATQIQEYAFMNCTALATINMPNITTIKDSAFRGCTSLDDVDIGAVTTLPNYCFYGCTALTDITAADLASIGYYAFYNCSSLESINLDKVTYINSNAFQGCTSLTEIDIKKTATLGQYAWRECTSLKKATIRGSGQSLPSYLFYGCSNLDTLVIDLADPTGNLPTLSSTASSVFYGSKLANATSGGAIYVTDSRVNELKARTNWTTLADIIHPLSELPSA